MGAEGAAIGKTVIRTAVPVDIPTLLLALLSQQVPPAYRRTESSAHIQSLVVSPTLR